MNQNPFQPNTQYPQQPQYQQPNTQFNQSRYPGNLTFYNEFTLATKFGIVMMLVSENKVGSDGVHYKKWGVMIKIIPAGNEPMTYDTNNAFTMKTSIDKVAALSGALLAAYYGRPVKYSIFTDSSKNQYANTQSKKSLTVSNVDENGNIVDGVFVSGFDSSKQGIKSSVKLTVFDAYGWHRVIEEFVSKAMEYILDPANKSRR